MKNFKFSENYSLYIKQILTFRTVILGCILGIFTSSAINGFITALNSQSNVIGSGVFALVGIGAVLYWIYHDFIIKNVTYTKNTDTDTKYNSYSLAEIVLEIQRNNDQKLRPQFHKKLLKHVSEVYQKKINFTYSLDDAQDILESTFEDLYDESYKIRNIPKVHNIEEAQKYIDKNTRLILYSFLSISEKFDTEKQYNYSDMIEQLGLSKKEKKQIQKISKEIMEYIKSNKLEDTYQMYSYDENTHIRIMYLIFYLIIFQYHAKEKIDIFYVLSCIVFPINILFALFNR